jgi:transcriptional regulator with XRE-family HTH domain
MDKSCKGFFTPTRTFAEAFSQALEFIGLSLQELSYRTRIHPSQLSTYRTGVSEPNLAQVRRIAVGLGLSTDWLLGLDTSRTPTPLHT